MVLNDILKTGAEGMGVTLTDEAIRLFEIYFRELEEENAHMNLTAITGESDIARLHFLDCLGILGAAGFAEDGASRLKNAEIIDIGSGAGFPGLPIKIAEPSARVTLLDGNQKKIGFLTGLCEKIGLPCECVAARAEELANKAEYRARFDYAVSRAVARLDVLCEISLPFVKTGGLFLAMKGAASDGEIAEAKAAVQILGGQIEGTLDYEIPGTGVSHRVVIIRKTSQTPEKYPRRYARIMKAPLT